LTSCRLPSKKYVGACHVSFLKFLIIVLIRSSVLLSSLLHSWPLVPDIQCTIKTHWELVRCHRRLIGVFICLNKNLLGSLRFSSLFGSQINLLIDNTTCHCCSHQSLLINGKRPLSLKTMAEITDLSVFLHHFSLLLVVPRIGASI